MSVSTPTTHESTMQAVVGTALKAFVACEFPAYAPSAAPMLDALVAKVAAEVKQHAHHRRSIHHKT